MLTEKHSPNTLNLWELDQYLERGWFRIGQMIFTTHFLFFGQNVYSALWIRLQLKQHQLKGSNRKLFRKITSNFNVLIRPAEITDEKEDLYAIYAANFDGNLSPNLQEMLFELSSESIFDTWEVAIYDQDKLIGCSFFDRGFTAIASIFAMYHPDYEKFSIGYFTLIAEVEYAKKNGYTQFYPGYIVPGYQRFEYKLRIGEVEYYDLKTEKWLDYSSLDPQKIPIFQIENKIDQMGEFLAAQNFKSYKLLYSFFEINLVSLGLIPPNSHFEFPIVLLIPNTSFLLITFDPRTELYHLLNCRDYLAGKNMRIEFLFSKPKPDLFLNQLIITESVIESSPHLGTIYKALLEIM